MPSSTRPRPLALLGRVLLPRRPGQIVFGMGVAVAIVARWHPEMTLGEAAAGVVVGAVLSGLVQAWRLGL